VPEHPDAAVRIRSRLAKGMLPRADVRKVLMVRGTGPASRSGTSSAVANP